MNELRLDVRSLRVFEAVAETRSVSLAATKIGVTQSAISQVIIQIEDLLGTKVLDRTCRPMKLTPSGIALRRHAQNVVDEMDRLLARVRASDLLNRPEIRVGMVDSFAATVGPAAIKKTIAQGNQVLLWSGLAESHAQALLQRKLDLIITSDPMDDMEDLARRPLFTEPFVIVLPASRRQQFPDGDLRQLDLPPYIRTRHHTKVDDSVLRLNSRGERYFNALCGCFSL